MKDRTQLIQQDYEGTDHFPWKVLVICQCLNQATWMVAEKVVAQIFEEYPSPSACDRRLMRPFMGCRTEDKLTDILRPLGFDTKRADRLMRMSEQYNDQVTLIPHYEFYPIESFSGCGQYARDAWNLFVLKRDCNPKDRLLKKYREKVYG